VSQKHLSWEIKSSLTSLKMQLLTKQMENKALILCIGTEIVFYPVLSSRDAAGGLHMSLPHSSFTSSGTKLVI